MSDEINADTLRALLAKLAKDDVVIFSKDEAHALQAIAQTYLGLKAFGKAASVVKSILQWVGWAIGVWLAIKLGLIEFIRGVVSK